MPFMKKEKKLTKSEEEALPTDDEFSSELEEEDLEEFKPRERDTDREKEIYESLTSQSGKKDDAELRSMKNDLFAGATITKKDVLEGRSGKGVVKNSIDTVNTRSIGANKEGDIQESEEDRKKKDLLAGGAGKMERLEMMKQREARKREEEETERKNKIKERNKNAELGIGGEEEIGPYGKTYVIQFDSDEERERAEKKAKKEKKKKSASSKTKSKKDSSSTGAGSSSSGKTKPSVKEVDIFDDDAWDAMMSKPLKVAEVSSPTRPSVVFDSASESESEEEEEEDDEIEKPTKEKKEKKKSSTKKKKSEGKEKAKEKESAERKSSKEKKEPKQKKESTSKGKKESSKGKKEKEAKGKTKEDDYKPFDYKSAKSVNDTEEIL
tara:strand:+ start:339 stop:1481 length:1143 start_codon:yes stop_codon:yes gene_type:complete